MEELQGQSEIKPPSAHKLVKYFPQFTLKVLHMVVNYTLKYLLLILTLLAECRRVYYFSTKQFSGGLGYDYEQDMGNLSKLPRHMSFVINEDVTTDYCDIANLIVWTIAMGIPYISLYDRHGILKAGESRLGKVIKQKVVKTFGQKKAQGIDVVLKDSSYRYQNGITYPKKFCVQLLSEEDGRADIISTTKRIAADYADNNIEEKNINIDHINKSLKAIENIPDPELVVQFGNIYSLNGYLPWQTRLSEILNLKTHKKICYSQYYNLLARFSKCDQRFGK